MILYHTGFDVIKEPDLSRGRRNADFGQGFYLTPDKAFAHRWAKTRKDRQTIINVYELDESDLVIHRFKRDQAWFDYLYGNRNHKPDPVHADAVIGPIANDTIYDTLGITTSGLLDPKEAMKLLLIGPEYIQAALKTPRAISRLKWLSKETLAPSVLQEYRQSVESEEAAYQEKFAKALEELT